MKVNLKKPIVVMVCLGFVCLIYTVWHDLDSVEVGENEAIVTWLPKTASNISYYKSYLITAYEFDISAQDFLALAKARNWPVQLIGFQPGQRAPQIMRYEFGLRRIARPNLEQYLKQCASEDPTDEEMQTFRRLQEAYSAAMSKVITKGYVYEHRQTNGGGFVVGYDEMIKRAYVWHAPR
jgi:hypothetical protein